MAGELIAAPLIEAHALARHVRMSPQKTRLVIDLIRGRRAEDALQILRFTPKRAARDIEKVLRSAIANEGSRWKRLRPAPMGRAFRYQRRTSHILVGVAEHHVAAKERAAAAAAEAESHKGVRGAVRKARKALAGKQARAKKTKK